MGIPGLLQALQPASVDIHIQAYSGKAVAIDSYCWLHKGAYGCALELIEGRKTDLYVRYCMRRVAMLLHYGVTPILVFDGAYLPSKGDKEDERKERRDKYKAKGMALLRAGNRSKAIDCFQKCVDVTPEMALELIKACKANGVEIVVAPYEADAQLAYLAKIGKVHAVITEDSDLLLYNCKRVIYKMDQYGNGRELKLDRIRSQLSDDPNAINLAGWDFGRIRQMCILAGCDYVPSLPGMGLKTAYKYFKKYRSAQEVLRALKGTSSFSVTPGYVQLYKQAEHTFLYQKVWCTDRQALVPFTEYPDGLDPTILDFAGPQMEQVLAKGIAEGRINPLTKTAFEVPPPEPAESASSESIFARYGRPYEPHSKKISDGPIQKNTMARYLTRAPSDVGSLASPSPSTPSSQSDDGTPSSGSSQSCKSQPEQPPTVPPTIRPALGRVTPDVIKPEPKIVQSKYFFEAPVFAATPMETKPQSNPKPVRRLGLRRKSSSQSSPGATSLRTFAYSKFSAPTAKKRTSPEPTPETSRPPQNLSLFARKRLRVDKEA